MLSSLFTDRARPLFEQARLTQLEPLRDDDLAEYIGDRFECSNRDAGEALDALLGLVRGHPQRAMLVSHHLWEHTPSASAQYVPQPASMRSGRQPQSRA